MSSRLVPLARAHRWIVLTTLDVIVWVLSFTVAAALRFETLDRTAPWEAVFGAAIAAGGLQVAIGAVTRLYEGRHRLGAVDDAAATAVATLLAGSLVTVPILAWTGGRLLPLGVPAVATGFAILGALGGRILLRTARDWSTRPRSGERVIVAGAGDTAARLIRHAMIDPGCPYVPVALLEDDPRKRNLRINGVAVQGRTTALPEVAERFRADSVLLAMPAAPEEVRLRISEAARSIGLSVRSAVDYWSGLRDVDRVLVIGGAGYIGSALVPRLLHAGYRVRVLDRLMFGKEPLGEWIDHQRLELVEADFREVHHVVEAMTGVDAVVHLGAIVGDPACAVHEDLTIEINLIATKMIAEVAKVHGVSRFIFASTCSVYGASDDLLDEDSALNPVSLYARTKIASERVLLELEDVEFRPTILRFGTVYGFSGRTRFDLVVNLLAAKAVVDGRITVFGEDQWRPFVHVEDVAMAVHRSLEVALSKVGGRTINIGSDEQNYTLGDVGMLVKEMVPTAELLLSEPDGDRRDYRVDFSRARDELGFSPDWTLERGIDQVVRAFDRRAVGDYCDHRYSNVRFLGEAMAKGLRTDKDLYHELVRDAARPRAFAAAEPTSSTRAQGDRGEMSVDGRT